MQVIRTTLYHGGYRSTHLDPGNGREWHCHSDPDGGNVRHIETRAARSCTGFRALGNNKRAEEISQAIKAHLAGETIRTARTLDGIEDKAMATLANDWSRLQIARSMLSELLAVLDRDEIGESTSTGDLLRIAQVCDHAKAAGITPDVHD